MEGKVTPSSVPLGFSFSFFIGDFGVKQMNAIFPGEMKAAAAALTLLQYEQALAFGME